MSGVKGSFALLEDGMDSCYSESVSAFSLEVAKLCMLKCFRKVEFP